MTSDKDLFEIFRQAIPDGFTPRYRVNRTTANVAGTVKVIPNVVTVRFDSAESPVILPSGDIRNRYRRISFQVYTDRGGQEKMDAGENACIHIMEYLSDFHNRVFEVTDDSGEIKKVRIISCFPITDISYIGMTEQGVHHHMVEFKIMYK